MKKLFLCSYFAGTQHQFKTFIDQQAINTKTVLFISTAANVESYTGYVDEGRQTLADMGFLVDELDIARQTTEQVIQKITEAQILMITGGNTFYLLQQLKKKNLLPLISHKINQGMLYIGESAGAIILTQNIEYSHIMDNPRLAPEFRDYQGLNMIDFYPLPHYIEPPFTETVQTTFALYHDKLRLVPINNHEAIIVTDTTHSTAAATAFSIL
ncbi:Type 1 glutamine amidotransferase-like domain-containing protein [Neisseriaceae bacterium ESL0693]|nr:Type 1 glutamine amidotransferase-like domain-containing protein [Neisseriaceae bacterium ESL0693]